MFHPCWLIRLIWLSIIIWCNLVNILFHPCWLIRLIWLSIIIWCKLIDILFHPCWLIRLARSNYILWFFDGKLISLWLKIILNHLWLKRICTFYFNLWFWLVCIRWNSWSCISIFFKSRSPRVWHDIFSLYIYIVNNKIIKLID